MNRVWIASKGTEKALTLREVDGWEVHEVAKARTNSPEDINESMDLLQKIHREANAAEPGVVAHSKSQQRRFDAQGVKWVEPASREASSYPLEDAVRLARLWRAGKMIGGDQDAVIEALLTEVERLTPVATHEADQCSNYPDCSICGPDAVKSADGPKCDWPGCAREGTHTHAGDFPGGPTEYPEDFDDTTY